MPIYPDLINYKIHFRITNTIFLTQLDIFHQIEIYAKKKEEDKHGIKSSDGFQELDKVNKCGANLSLRVYFVRIKEHRHNTA